MPKKRGGPVVLSINAGSSSIRFAAYEVCTPLRRLLAGKIDRIGLNGTTLTISDPAGRPPRPVKAADHSAAADYLLKWLETQPIFGAIEAVGHRVVHGLSHSEPARISPALLKELRRITPYAPDHLPREIALIQAVQGRHPTLAQVACFDTAFHRTMPRVATLLAIPHRYQDLGVVRYGFHGISCSYLMEELNRLDASVARGRVILAHLGNGASVTAVLRGRSIDTSMGFTPAAGLVMSRRSGDLDPGLLAFMARSEGMTPARFDRMVNHESGLLGISGSSSDVRDLLAAGAADPRAADAIGLFCHQARKWIGACAATLGGLDAIVFAGGIGENAPQIRSGICTGLEFLGVRIDARRNARNAAVISTSAGRTAVRVIRTDEELMIARSTIRLLRLRPSSDSIS